MTLQPPDGMESRNGEARPSVSDPDRRREMATAVPELDTRAGRRLTSGVDGIDGQQPEDAVSDGQVVGVSVVFADLRGFTSIVERGASQHSSMLLNGYLDAMMDVITACHGMVQDFVGDGIMAVFGIPTPDPE